jgi:hypothetical protein
VKASSRVEHDFDRIENNKDAKIKDGTGRTLTSTSTAQQEHSRTTATNKDCNRESMRDTDLKMGVLDQHFRVFLSEGIKGEYLRIQ